MKNTIHIISILSLLLFSCNTENQIIEIDTSEIDLLEDQIKNQKSEEKKLLTELDDVKAQLDSAKKNSKDLENNFINESYYNNVVLLNNILNNSQERISNLGKVFNLKEPRDVLTILTNHWGNPEHESGIYSLIEGEYRATKFLNAFFDEKNIDFIISILNKDNIYKNSRLDLYTHSLLEAYEKMGENDHALLDELYNLSKNGYFKNEEEINTLLNKVNNLDEDIYETSFKNYVSGMNGFFNIYSFWARRQQEGNSEVVYTIMKKIDTKLTQHNEILDDEN